MSLTTRRKIWLRDNGVCWLCGESVPFLAMHADHVVPSRAGGSEHITNLRAAHERCNLTRVGASGRPPILSEDGEALDRMNIKAFPSQIAWVKKNGGSKLIRELIDKRRGRAMLFGKEKR